MPKKKKSQDSERKPAPSVQARANIEESKLDSIPDEDTLRRMKEKMLNEKPELRQMFQYMEKLVDDGTKQAQDSSVVFTNRRGYVTPELLMQYPNSPTARKTMEALNHYVYAFNILWSYKKPRVLLQSDCDCLQPGLHHFIEGYMTADYMLQQFHLPPSFTYLVEDYLQLRPNDILVEYIYVNVVVALKTKELPDYERCKETIRALEIFVHKLLPYEHEETAKRILIDSYYVLGAKYTSTDQNERALDAFEKCYALDETNVGAIYSVAFHYQAQFPEKALMLCNKYLDIASKCDEKFPHVHYVMGFIYACHFKNIKLAKKYYLLGKKAETYRLPFNPPADFTAKCILESIMPLAESNSGILQNAFERIDMKKLTQK